MYPGATAACQARTPALVQGIPALTTVLTTVLTAVLTTTAPLLELNEHSTTPHMARPSLTTSEHFIDVAMRLFWEKGYGATSNADILHGAGANAGSLYHCFPTGRIC